MSYPLYSSSRNPLAFVNPLMSTNGDTTYPPRRGQPLEYKIVLFGAGGVGKSAITLQFVQGRFDSGWDPTIEDQYVRPTVVDGKEYNLNITDTAGQEEFRAMRPQYMRSADGFLLVYDVTTRGTFEEITRIHSEILREKDLATYGPIVIVGNKNDLTPLRQVETSEGKALATNLGCQFLETSARFRDNVEESFHLLVREIRKFQKGSLDRRLGCHTVKSRTSQLAVVLSADVELHFCTRLGIIDHNFTIHLMQTAGMYT